MKYFIISNSNELSEIGNYPQVEQIEGFNYYSSKGYLNVSWKELPSFSPDYSVKIHGWAKPTNLLHSLSGVSGLTVDSKLKNILGEFNLPEHRFFAIDVFYKKKRLDYYWFHFTNSFLEYIDLDKSEFEKIRNQNFEPVENLKVKSLSELNDNKRKLTFEFSIREKVIALKPNFPNFDIISMRGVKPIFLVSERLKTEIENNQITGCHFSEYKRMILTN